MNKLRKSESGIAHFVVLLVVVIIAVGSAGYFVYSQNTDSDAITSSDIDDSQLDDGSNVDAGTANTQPTDD